MKAFWKLILPHLKYLAAGIVFVLLAVNVAAVVFFMSDLALAHPLLGGILLSLLIIYGLGWTFMGPNSNPDDF